MRQTKNLSFCVLFLSLCVAPLLDVRADDQVCKDYASKLAKSLSSNSDFKGNANAKTPEYPGSSAFKTCQQYTDKDWKEIAKSTSSGKIWDRGWNTFVKETTSKLIKDTTNCAQLIVSLEEVKDNLISFSDELMRCEGLRKITAKTDYNNPKQVGGGKAAVQSSLDQKIKCNSRGPETRDYEACVTTLNFYNGALVGQTVFTQVQELNYQGHAIENSVLDPNDPTAGLKSQQKDIQKRASMTQTRAGIDVVKGAGLLALWQSIPTYSEVIKDCNSSQLNQAARDMKAKYDSFVSTMRREVVPPSVNDQASEIYGTMASRGNNPLTAEALAKNCKNEVQGQFVIINESARNSIKEAMILAGIDGIKHSVAANLLKKQANEVGKMINEVDNFNPTGLEYLGDEFNGSECALNPAAEGCDEFLNRRSFGFGSNAPIQIHGMENASMFGRNDSEIGGPSNNAAASPVDRANAPKPIGFFDVDAANPSGLVDTARAAGVTSDGPGSGGGGGGGGAPAGGGGGGGGAPAGGASDAPRMGLPAAGTTNLAYSRGTGGLRGSGGRGAQGGRSAEGSAENPFEGLFGGENPTGANLNFREGASEEGQINMPDTSIFEIISGRYMAVHENDRLLQYEAAEEDAGPLR